LFFRLLRRAGVAHHLEFGDHQVVLGRCVTSLVILVVRFLGNRAANGNQAAYVWHKRYILAFEDSIVLHCRSIAGSGLPRALSAALRDKILIFENDYFRVLPAICSSNAIILFVLRI
jgi:hypothetical protein